MDTVPTRRNDRWESHHFQSRTSSVQTVCDSVWVTLCDLWRVGDDVCDGMWVRVC